MKYNFRLGDVVRVDPETNEPLPEFNYSDTELSEAGMPVPETFSEGDLGVKANYVMLGAAALFFGVIILGGNK